MEETTEMLHGCFIVCIIISIYWYDNVTMMRVLWDGQWILLREIADTFYAIICLIYRFMIDICSIFLLVFLLGIGWYEVRPCLSGWLCFYWLGGGNVTLIFDALIYSMTITLAFISVKLSTDEKVSQMLSLEVGESSIYLVFTQMQWTVISSHIRNQL